MMNKAVTLAIASLALLLGACTSGGGTPQPGPEPAKIPAASTTLTLQESPTVGTWTGYNAGVVKLYEFNGGPAYDTELVRVNVPATGRAAITLPGEEGGALARATQGLGSLLTDLYIALGCSVALQTDPATKALGVLDADFTEADGGTNLRLREGFVILGRGTFYTTSMLVFASKAGAVTGSATCPDRTSAVNVNLQQGWNVYAVDERTGQSTVSAVGQLEFARF